MFKINRKKSKREPHEAITNRRTHKTIIEKDANCLRNIHQKLQIYILHRRRENQCFPQYISDDRRTF